jgi:DNA-binding transcriptional LysR family regulator
MEIRQIRYFVAVAEEGNFSAAARRLFVSQPPITRQIQQLEEELGARLFERTQKGVRLTPAGTAFLAEARQILTRTRLAAERSQAAAAGEIGKLEIGYFGSAIYSVIPGLIRKFCRRHPQVDISLLPMSKKEQVDAIKDGRIHIGFGRYYPSDAEVTVETVARENVLLAIAEGHPLARDSSVALNKLLGNPIIVFPRDGRPSFADEIVRIVRRTGAEPQIGHEAIDLSSALALTAAGLGICPVPESVTHLQWPNVRFMALQGLRATSPVNCIHAANSDSPILQKFLATLHTGLAPKP